MPHRVALRIYWQALVLVLKVIIFLKKCPIVALDSYWQALVLVLKVQFLKKKIALDMDLPWILILLFYRAQGTLS